MHHTFIMTSILLAVLVVGCNTQTVTGESRERLVHPTPVGARWVKDGMTKESRKGDWVACGGGADLQDGFRRWLDPESRKSYFEGLDNHELQLRKCMQSRGYNYRNPQISGRADECHGDVCLHP